jgi:hypothetical protein
MPSRVRLSTAALLLCLAAPALAADGLANASFDEGLGGWDVGVGATSGQGGSESVLAKDTDVVRDGKASLRCSGDAGTTSWRMLTQTVDVAAGDLVSLRVAARCEKVVREGSQYANANGLVIFETIHGDRTGFVTTAVLGGDREWVDLGLDVRAPKHTARARVGVFHSMSGTTWFDDVRFTATSMEPFGEEARAAALFALEGHMTRSYSFWGYDEKPDDPAALFAKHAKACLAAKDKASFARGLQALLAELDDTHVTIRTPMGLLPTAKPGVVVYPLRAVLGRVSEKVVHGKNVMGGWIGEGDERVAYLLVASFALPRHEQELVDTALDAFRGAQRMVVDVRPNGGGDETQAMRIASRWTSEDVVYARNLFRDPTLPPPDGFLPPTDRVLRAAPEESRIDARVVLLSSPFCVSSTEGFLLMGKALPNVTVVGEPSRGASANPGGLELCDGLTVWTSRWRSLGLDGVCIEGRGVEPDVVVEPEGVTRNGDADPVLDRAVELLRE